MGFDPVWLIVLGVGLGIMPLFLMMATSYVKIVVVLLLVRNALGVDPWSLESIERRAKRAWLNLRDRIENFEFSAPDFSELKEKFYDWLPFTEKETPAEPTRGGAI